MSLPYLVGNQRRHEGRGREYRHSFSFAPLTPSSFRDHGVVVGTDQRRRVVFQRSGYLTDSDGNASSFVPIRGSIGWHLRQALEHELGDPPG